jgi:hypothetical protein
LKQFNNSKRSYSNNNSRNIGFHFIKKAGKYIKKVLIKAKQLPGHRALSFDSNLVDKNNKLIKNKKVIIGLTKKPTCKLNMVTKEKFGNVYFSDNNDSYVHCQKYAVDRDTFNKLEKNDKMNTIKKRMNNEALLFEIKE